MRRVHLDYAPSSLDIELAFYDKSSSSALFAVCSSRTRNVASSFLRRGAEPKAVN
jgi:hypothetical protein